jgi:hypothetical protein
METSERLAEILQVLDQGVIRPSEVRIHVGLMLAEFGSANDVKDLPPWIREDLVEWAHGFERTKTWLLISSVSDKDVSTQGLKLLDLIKEAGLLP